MSLISGVDFPWFDTRTRGAAVPPKRAPAPPPAALKYLPRVDWALPANDFQPAPSQLVAPVVFDLGLPDVAPVIAPELAAPEHVLTGATLHVAAESTPLEPAPADAPPMVAVQP